MCADIQQRFMENITKTLHCKAKNSTMLTKDDHNNFITRLEELEEGCKKTQADYSNTPRRIQPAMRRGAMYQTLIHLTSMWFTCHPYTDMMAYMGSNGGSDRLLERFQICTFTHDGMLKKRLIKRDTDLTVVTLEELFDIINDIHLSTGHGGRDVLRDKVKKLYANVTTEQIMLYLQLCEACNLKKSHVIRKSLAVKPIVSAHFNSCSQVEDDNVDGGEDFTERIMDQVLEDNEVQASTFVATRKVQPMKTRSSRVVPIANETYNGTANNIGVPLRDEYSTYGEHVANKLRKLDDHDRAVAQHKINNILFEAEMGQYRNVHS